MLMSFFKPAKRGFSSDSVSPIWATGPKRPTFTYTFLPEAGSVPSSFSPLNLPEFSVVEMICWWKPL